jgi:hypothetical protein
LEDQVSSLKRLLCCSLIVAVAILAHATGNAHGQTSAEKPKGTASISGRVTVGNKAAAGILITALGGTNQQTVAAKATTDADGRYSFEGLAMGQFTLAPVAPAYALPDNSPFGRGKVVNLASGEVAEGIDFKLARGGVITGRVTDADGRLLIEERISLSPIDESGAPLRQQYSFYSNYQMYQTDDRGVYRIYGLAAGRYKVSSGDEAGMSAGLRSSGYYQKTYYPSATDAAQASIVELGEGGEAKNIDITLGHRAATYTASGRIVDADTGQPVPGIPFAFGPLQQNQSQSYIAGMMSPGTPTNSQGEFRLEGLEPGRYGVFISTGRPDSASGYYSDPVSFEVLDSDVTNLEIKAQRGLNLSGAVVAESITDKSALARLSSIRISANVTPGPGAVRVFPSTSTSAIGPDGSFQLTGLRPGKASLYLSSSSGSNVNGFLITRIEHNGVPQAQLVDIQPGADTTGVRIFLAYGTGVIRGQVKFEGGTLPSDSMLMIMLRREGVPTRGGTQVDSRGQFVIENLAAGTYEVMVQLVNLGPVRPPPRPSMPVRQTVTVSDGTESQVLLTFDLNPKQGP